jgi:hypothetical protein
MASSTRAPSMGPKRLFNFYPQAIRLQNNESNGYPNYLHEHFIFYFFTDYAHSLD